MSQQATITLTIQTDTPIDELAAWCQPAITTSRGNVRSAAGVVFTSDPDDNEEVTAPAPENDDSEIAAVTALETKLIDALEQVVALKLALLRKAAA